MRSLGRSWLEVAWVASLAVGAAGGRAAAGNWPQFRGPTATGVTEEHSQALPVAWGGKEDLNVLWRVDLPKTGESHSSPVVWGDRVYVTTSLGRVHRVSCFARANGKLLWDTSIEPGPLVSKDTRGGGLADPTPATDGRHVFVLFGTACLSAVRCEDGKEVWRTPLTRLQFDVTLGSSPVLWQDTVVLFSGLNEKASNITAFDKATGRPRWVTDLPKIGFGHSTPAFASVGGTVQMILSVNDKAEGIIGVDPGSGKVLWSAPGDGETASPAVGSGAVYCDSGRGGGGYAADLPRTPGAGGEPPQAKAATDAAAVRKLPAKWQVRRVPQDLSSPVIVGDRIYRISASRELVCLNLADGSEAYSEKLPGASPWASPFATADGVIYFASAGKSYVVQAGPTFKIVAASDLGDPSHASAAVSDGMIFLKGRKSLFCVGKKSGTRTSDSGHSTPNIELGIDRNR